MRVFVDEALWEEGWSWCEYVAIKVLCESAGMTQMALAERTALDRTRVSEALRRLEEDAMIERTGRSLQRRRLVRATARGRALRDTLVDAVDAAEQTTLSPLTEADRVLVGSLLARTLPPGPPRY
jgi:DNA-binding MarR family transcriptional regulator